MIKSLYRILFLSLIALTLTAMACSRSQSPNTEQEKVATDASQEQNKDVVYQCPMKCEGDKTYPSNTKCPKCGMDLEPIAAKQ
ncbi:MAG: hypothetical protein KA010_00865 [Saprospiraceae bacterium]|nr:hypothetical protein [Saprospiraceae bacterium]